MKKEIGHSSFKQTNWLMSSWADVFILFVPVWLLWVIFFSNASYFQSVELPVWAWVVFVLGIDVSHVWSSLFRTYLVKEDFQQHRKLLLLTPILALIASVLLLSFAMDWFWRVMAYVAVFHFIKQQFGFVALYKLKVGEVRKQIISDKKIIYLATVYPVLYWHFNSTAKFNWFVRNDFIPLYKLFPSQDMMLQFFQVMNVLYWGVIAFWLVFEIKAFVKKEKVSLGKILWVLTTALNWWFGIVYYNSDVIFSVSNVVAHGIPYIALIYYYNLKKEEIITKQSSSLKRKIKWVIALLVTILIAALIEEYFWDMFIYREHIAFFENIHPYRWDQLANEWGIIVGVAILALPQQVHYIIDGFIWKMNGKNQYLKPIFKSKDES
ncbi:hypothetical protein [Crocinitomix catalasitica]|uniref:hypothetical protein n=1 Tax=Crocinitomix catalasitica TaxID=184607 RepID=UPI000483CCF0|nr:hypothetical protein [Crocinitomix catalasitica]